jgi:hypothetical protein
MAVRIKGTTNLQEVDVNGNAHVNGPLVDVQAGFQSMLAENDAGTVTGSRYVKAVEVSDDFRVRTGQDNMIFNETFPGFTLNTAIWSTTLSGVSNVVSGGFLALNSAGVLTSGVYGTMRTYRHFPCYKQYTTYAEMEIQLSSAPVSGNRCEWGLMLAATTAAPTDGAFFRVDSTGVFTCVMNYNGVETQSGALSTALLGVATTHSYLIYIGSTVVEFWINNILVAEILCPAGQGSTMSSMNLPLAFRNINVSTLATPQILKVGNVNVTFGDQAMSKPWGHVIAGAGGSALQMQTGAATFGSTSLITNAAAAVAAALSNTTAAAQFTGLGGIFNVLPTLTAGTDGILCSYLVPVGTAAYPGKTLYVTGIKIDSVVSTVLAGGPLINVFSIAFGGTAVSLATAEATGGIKAPRRLALGIQSFVAAAAVGAVAPTLQDDYTCSPVVCHPGEYFQVAVRNIGTVTTTGALTYTVAITGYWE